MLHYKLTVITLADKIEKLEFLYQMISDVNCYFITSKEEFIYLFIYIYIIVCKK